MSLIISVQVGQPEYAAIIAARPNDTVVVDNAPLCSIHEH